MKIDLTSIARGFAADLAQLPEWTGPRDLDAFSLGTWERFAVYVRRDDGSLTADDQALCEEIADAIDDAVALTIAALERINGAIVGDQVIYYDDAMGGYYAGPAADLADLGELMESDDPDIARDAYSHWCAGSSHAGPFETVAEAERGQAFRQFKTGDRVQGGTPGTDGYDTGTVQGYWDDDELTDDSPGCVPGAVYVAWDSLVSTWDDEGALEPLA